MNPPALVSANVRRAAREYLVGWTLGQIGDVFEDHGFQADTSFTPATSGQRRSYVEQFYRLVDWSARDDVERMLGVFEAVLDDAEGREANDHLLAADPWSTKFVQMLARDGVVRDDTGRLRPRWVSLTSGSVDRLPSQSAIPVLLRRMWENVEDDPDAAIGAAKEAIEATAKHVLLAVGEAVGDAEKMPSLVTRAQDALGVHAKTVDPSKAGSESIRAILGSLTKVALGINDLRRDYGTGHGRPVRAAGLTARHARLAAQAADAWVCFVLETEEIRRAARDAS